MVVLTSKCRRYLSPGNMCHGEKIMHSCPPKAISALCGWHLDGNQPCAAELSGTVGDMGWSSSDEFPAVCSIGMFHKVSNVCIGGCAVFWFGGNGSGHRFFWSNSEEGRYMTIDQSVVFKIWSPRPMHWLTPPMIHTHLQARVPVKSCKLVYRNYH